MLELQPMEQRYPYPELKQDIMLTDDKYKHWKDFVGNNIE